MAAGMMMTLGYAGSIRAAYRRAIELDVQNMDARFSPMQFYTQAPAIIGGGNLKARALAAETAGVNAEDGKLMQAELDSANDKLAPAEAALLGMATRADAAVAEVQRDLLLDLGKKYWATKSTPTANACTARRAGAFPAATARCTA